MVKIYSHYQVPRISFFKATLLLSKQWTQVQAKEEELHIVQSIDYTGWQKAQKCESNDANNRYYIKHWQIYQL